MEIDYKNSTRGQLARNYFLEGYNCTQSVVLAFADELELEKSTILKLSSSFGGGMGRLREVCGAVSGMCIVAGLKYGYDSPKDGVAKGEHYARIQQLAKEFEQINGAIVCRELLGLSQKKDAPTPEARTAEYYKKRPCTELVAIAAAILEAYIDEQEQGSAIL